MEVMPAGGGTPINAAAEIAAIAAVERAVLAAGTPVDVGGGNYAFHPDELKSVIDGWKGITDKINAALAAMTTRAPHNPTVLKPGNENASTTASDAAHNTNLAYQGHLTNMLSYAQTTHDKLQTIYNNYMTTDQTHAETYRSLQA